ncbi:hypothetical protein A2164_00520 [Candidatus Curtissbacteria bacterium RBG_13_35_7]|uniref:GlcNAc-PI de-N-acetylase n=1 Tax=Candidatus Curtissbacteria bacterium RBG_13_35_7 TaxID=1797705 RepID=A0A1F5G2E9_9BACT|nr:MAG: hypothetical protein A2164_00520 [Candidatus Curtissbacteria bacterium RBG_13_35_7]
MHFKTQNNLKSIIKHGPVVAIFAHPDDEAFGPAGTLTKLAKNHDVYVLCATKGEEGGDHKRLAQIRASELQKSAKIIGIKKVFFLGFIDGTLSNSLYHKLAQTIEKRLRIIKPQTIITFEPRGISGHIDHITISMVTSYVFYRLDFTKTMLQHCITEKSRKVVGDYFIYFPPGYKTSKIDLIVNVENEWDIKLKAMMAHKSQIGDAKRILKRHQKFPKEEYFLVTQK